MPGEKVDISPAKDGGVLKEVLAEGAGAPPPAGATVQVHYTGRLLDGTQFDSSRDRGAPFEFALGAGSVIRGWDVGVAAMRRGERALLTCAAAYAYGEAGSPPTIPPGATLEFDVEVLGWRLEDVSPAGDGGIERAIVTPGEKQGSNPNDGALVEAHLVGTFEGREFDVRDVSWTVGEGSAQNVIDGIDLTIEKFKKGETSKLIIKPNYAFGATGSTEFNIPPNATVEYVVTLKTFEKAKENWALDSKERVEQAQLFKDKGTEYFKQSVHKLAIRNYKKALEYLETPPEEEQKETADALTLAANLNLALCYLKTGDNFEAKTSATAALALDGDNVKAYFRRGLAYLSLSEPQLAAKDFNRCIEIEPGNVAAKQQLLICAQTHKNLLQKEKRVYANMFDKFAKMDAQREESEKKKEPNVMSSVGEWGKEDREREPSEFEKENPNILLLNNTGEFKDM